MNHIFTTHSLRSFETQRTRRKADMIVTRIPRDPSSGHASAPPAQVKLVSVTRRVSCMSRILISPILLKAMDSLCDLCASSVAGGEIMICCLGFNA